MKRANFKRAQDWPGGFYNPRQLLVVRYQGHEYRLNTGHGSQDEVDVWETPGGYFHVATRNTGLDYVGALDFGIEEHLRIAHDPSTDVVEPLSSVFYQYDHEIKHVFGRCDAVTYYSPLDLYRRMAPYLAA